MSAATQAEDRSVGRSAALANLIAKLNFAFPPFLMAIISSVGLGLVDMMVHMAQTYTDLVITTLVLRLQYREMSHHYLTLRFSQQPNHG